MAEFDDSLYLFDVPAPADEVAAVESRVLDRPAAMLGVKVLADNLTMPKPEVIPAFEVEKVDREAQRQQEFLAITQPYYHMAANALRDDGYDKKVVGRWKNKYGRAKWSYAEPESEFPGIPSFVYNFAVHYDPNNQFEPTALTVGVAYPYRPDDERLRIGIEFDDGVAARVGVSCELPKEKSQQWEPMFMLRMLMRQEDLRRNSQTNWQSQKTTLDYRAEEVLVGDQHSQVDEVFDIGNLPMTVYRNTYQTWVGKRRYSNQTVYDPATDKFILQGTRHEATDADAEKVQYALSVLLGVIPTHDL